MSNKSNDFGLIAEDVAIGTGMIERFLWDYVSAETWLTFNGHTDDAFEEVVFGFDGTGGMVVVIEGEGNASYGLNGDVGWQVDPGRGNEPAFTKGGLNMPIAFNRHDKTAGKTIIFDVGDRYALNGDIGWQADRDWGSEPVFFTKEGLEKPAILDCGGDKNRFVLGLRPSLSRYN